MNSIASAFIKVFFAVLVTASAAIAGVDFDHDGKADFALFRPSNGVWYAQSPDGSSFNATRWGLANDKLVPADYDGDGQTDIAVWRPENGVWYISRSSDAHVQFIKWGMTTQHPTGGLEDVPVPADYDGDRIADIAVWRPDTGEWFILKSSENFNQTKCEIHRWGRLGDVPVQADYDGDGRTDIAVFRTMEDRWHISRSSDRQTRIETFGRAGDDLLVAGDYTGDGKADIAIYRTGTWFVLDSETREVEPFVFGFSDDVPAPADYDGDGTVDFAVYRSGIWYVHASDGTGFKTFNFGRQTDIPLNSLDAKASVVAVP